MPASSIDKMLETMMMQLLSPDHDAASVACCSCSKEKKRHKKRRRKMKKSCLKTVICLAKMAKDSGEYQGSSCDRGSRNMSKDEDDRYCSKCGQPLQDMLYQTPTNHPKPALQPLQRSLIELTEIGVQTNVEPKEPLAVRIKVCPCPNNNPRGQDEGLHHTASSPELSRTNPRLVNEPTSDNLVSTREPRSHFTDRSFDEPLQPHPPSMGFSDRPAWTSGDIASIKALALKMAKARLLEESAWWEREQQSRQRQMEEEPSDELEDVDPQRSYKSDGAPPGQHKSPLCGDQLAPRPSDTPRGSKYPTNMNYSYPEAGRYKYSGTSNFGTPFHPMQDMPIGCCSGANVYCYNPENGLTPFGNHCEHACTCQNTSIRFQQYRFSDPYTGSPYQPAYQQQQQQCTGRARSPCL